MYLPSPIVRGLLFASLFLSATERARSQPAASPIEFKNGLVVSVSKDASEAGLDALKRGGTAVDAAIATAFALAVTLPEAGNIGGGGFMLVHTPTGEAVVFDFRETAPAAATIDTFVKETDPHSMKTVGIPGTIRGLEMAHAKYGKLPWKSLVAPAVKLAKDGYVLDAYQAKAINRVLAESKAFPEFRRVYSRPDGAAWKAGDRMVLSDLAKTLDLIANEGPTAFYQGPLADAIAADMKQKGGLITTADLAGYKAIERAPFRGQYRGYEILAPNLPSSGGPVLSLMFNMLETFEVKKSPRLSPQTLHLMTEVMRRAYLERALGLGDPAFTPLPKIFESRDGARRLASNINPEKATSSLSLATARKFAVEGESTTHLSAADAAGWSVSMTYTLQESFGSRQIVPGTGFLLNNEMTDFNWKPGLTTTAGVIGTPPNQVAPGKRMLSSQCPTILLKNGKVRVLTGSPGGRTIPNTVFNILVSVIDYDMPIQDAVNLPRIHHQWLPDVVRLEKTSEMPETVAALKKMGHDVVQHRQGDAHSIAINPATGAFTAGVDRRLSGHAAGY